MSFEEFLTALGNMHDCRISKLQINVESASIEISVDDIYSNFEGLPEYPGLLPGVILLTGVSDLCGDLGNLTEGLKVYEIRSRKTAADVHELNMSVWPSGRLKASYQTAYFPTLL